MPLPDRIVAILDGAEPMTVPELGRALRCRDHVIRDIVRTDPRFEIKAPPAGRPRQARLYGLAKEVVRDDGTSSEARSAATPSPGPGSPAPSLWWLHGGGPRTVGEAIRQADAEKDAA